MGKASSSKKVARAAGTGGGRTNRSSTPWTFVGLIALIVVVGLALTFTSRNRAENLKNATTSANAASAPKVGGTPWNEGFAVDICGKFATPIKVTSDTEGLTTDGNGVIHIAPKIKAAAGKNATLGEFAKSVGMKLSGSEIGLPGSKTYSNGDDCSGKSSKLYIKQYPYAGATVSTTLTQDPTSIRLADGDVLELAFVSSKSDIPAPPSYVTTNLKAATAPTTTTTLPASSTTTKGSTSTTSGSTATTTEGSTSTTSGSTATTTKGSTSNGSTSGSTATTTKGSTSTTPATGS